MIELSRAARHWASHLPFLAAVLLTAAVFVGFEGYFIIDEAAIYAQVEVIEQGDWTVSRPFPDLDPTGDPPMVNSGIVGDEFAPFEKHPMHVWLLRGADAMAGRFGIRLVTIAGVVAAAGFAGALAAPLGWRQAMASLWIVGLASPLVFDAQLVLAHALGAAVVGALLLVVSKPFRSWTIPMAAALATMACWLRSEAILFAGALALVLAAQAMAQRRMSRVLVAGAVVVGAVGGRAIEILVRRSVVGDLDVPQAVSEQLERGTVSAILSGARIALLEPFVSRELSAPLQALLPIVVLLAAASATVLIFLRDRERTAAVLAGAAAVTAVLWAISSDVVSGIVWAFPALTIAALVTMRDRSDERRVWLSVAVFLLFGVAVLLTQYEIAGGLEWGWRYVAIGLPALGPWLGDASVRLWSAARSLDGRVAVGCIAAACLVVPAGGILDQRRTLQRTDRFLEATQEIFDRSNASLIVTNQRFFGRFAWPQSVRGDVMLVAQDNTSVVLERLAEEGGVERLAFVWHVAEPPTEVDLGPYVREAVEIDLGSGYRAYVLTQ